MAPKIGMVNGQRDITRRRRLIRTSVLRALYGTLSGEISPGCTFTFCTTHEFLGLFDGEENVHAPKIPNPGNFRPYSGTKTRHGFTFWLSRSKNSWKVGESLTRYKAGKRVFEVARDRAKGWHDIRKSESFSPGHKFRLLGVMNEPLFLVRLLFVCRKPERRKRTRRTN